ncbi:hypothetical protein OESDEN_06894 [Oesophagostomum dentatum]|uniref:Uncharacterized protein n=1 Tax=Oesophagostomum dentatum TaxID=61180 RepID=A0A0B1T7J9_OESDE|nr:hypothetical protein OESDEN_06894 [Oesophagostomum dentatum]
METDGNGPDHRSFMFKNPDDVLNKLGVRYFMLAIIICSLSWGFGAISVMLSVFISIDCGNCSGTMLTIVSEFFLVLQRLEHIGMGSISAAV